VSIVVLGNDKTISTVTPIEYSAKAPIRALTVTFALNSAVLSSAQKTELRRVAKIIDREGFTRLVVSGFTDAQGSAMANKKLSAARASATAAFLAQLLPEITVKTSAQGAKTPVKAGTSASAYAANRRSEISVW
jgi:outer membrane protein OmpA-like peptidoglycan-associated protein